MTGAGDGDQPLGDGPGAPAGTHATAPGGRLVAVGCFTAFLGCISGGMVGVLVAKFVAFVTRAQSCPGIPTCDWYLYWAGGALVGAVTLPVLAVRALRRPRTPGS